uniref:Uncharacterized protein n=1 Tax=Arundo donax TaxID=35708 RepID=A0A0A9DQN5_ARUDO
MKRHTCGRDTEMTSQVHMNNCGQQPRLEEVQKLSAKDLVFDELQWDLAYPRISFYEHQPQLSYLKPWRNSQGP